MAEDAEEAGALTDRQAAFVLEYLVDLNGRQAAIRAGYSAATATVTASRLLTNVNVAAAVAEAQAARSERTGITAEMVLQEFWAIATSDPNELIEYRQGCCRHCWGHEHRYQETVGERERRHTQWKRDAAAAVGKPNEAAFQVFDDLGGIGFNATLDPNPDCPECFGEGVAAPRAKDTRLLSPGGRALYAGVKVTKDGLEIKMHDKVAALNAVAKHLGMFTGDRDVPSEPGKVIIEGGLPDEET